MSLITMRLSLQTFPQTWQNGKLSFNLIASGVVGPAVSYALGQGATLVAAIWGVFIWREFRDAPAGTGWLIGLMFAGYGSGLALIGMATQ